MKSLNSLKIIALSVVASMVLVGCGSDTASNSAAATSLDTSKGVTTPGVEEPTRDVTLSGTAIDPELQGATVYIDANENSQFDEGEQFAITDKDGKYVLNITKENLGKPLVVEGGVDKVTKEDFLGRLTLIASSADGEQFITPLTTLVHEFKAQNPNATLEDVKAELATKLGLADVTDLDKDILKDTKLLKTALRIQKIAENVASSSNEEVQAVYQRIAKSLKEKGFDDALQTVIAGDLNKSSLQYEKLADLNKELHDMDFTGVNYEEFALSVDNVDRNITRTKRKEDLKHTLFDDADIIISGSDEVKKAQLERILAKMGVNDKEGILKEKLLGDETINFKNIQDEGVLKKIREHGFKNIADKLEKRPFPKEIGNNPSAQSQSGSGETMIMDDEMEVQSQVVDVVTEMTDTEMETHNEN